MHAGKPILLSILFFAEVFSCYGQATPATQNAKDTLSIKVDSLKAAVVTAVMRPHMKGDTLEFNTEHAKMRPNALVEDLLRRLPGLQIDPDGTITYNGEKIQHLLVDGEDIFGDNPTLVTRNFDASKIARVQILDRKSDQATFTGVDDGSRTKTLNLVIKETAKDGYFGRVDAAGDVKGHYEGSGSLAGFKDKEQITALAAASNTGNTANLAAGGSDPLGATAGKGIPELISAGLHYANSWNLPVSHLSGNYEFGHNSTRPITDLRTIQTESDSIYGQLQSTWSVNQQDQHQLNIVGDGNTGTKSAFRFVIAGNRSAGQNQFGANASSTFNDTLVNNSQRSIRDQVTGQSFSGNFGWRTQIGKKQGSVLSVMTGAGKTESAASGYLYSVEQFYMPTGQLESGDTIDQFKLIKDGGGNLSGTINYTLPIYPGAILAGSYGLSHSSDHPILDTYNKGDGKYTDIVDSLSSELSTVTNTQEASMNLEAKTKVLKYTIGARFLDYKYRQYDLLADSVFHLHYSNISPRVLLNYTPSPSINFKFVYRASTQAPNPAELIPIENNTDPMHIMLGNPNLRPTFNQDIEFGLRLLKEWNMGLQGMFAFSDNSISERTTIDSLGRQISQFLNVPGGTASNINIGINRSLLGVMWGGHIGDVYSASYSYINDDLNRTSTNTTEFGFVASKYATDRYSLYLRSNFSYFNSRNSINISAPIHYWTDSYSGTFAVYIHKDYELKTDLLYTWQEKSNNFAGNTSVVMWSGSIARIFLNNSLSVKFSVNNILNDNAAIGRSYSGNTYSQSSTNVLGRYMLLSISYHFDKNFKKRQ